MHKQGAIARYRRKMADKQRRRSSESAEVETGLSLHHIDKAHVNHTLFEPSKAVRVESHVSSMEEYRRLYDQSISDPALFWSSIAKQFYWKEPWNDATVHSYNFDRRNGKIFVEWFKGGKTNVCYNVLDHQIKAKGSGDRVAFYWVGNDPAHSRSITYSELLVDVCKFANVLKAQGVKKGDRVAIYMPMVIELVVAMLACARIGAVHSIVFGGFSADSLANRMIDAKSAVLVTADGVYRGSKLIHLKEIADQAVEKCKAKEFSVRRCIVLQSLKKEEVKGEASPAKRRHIGLPWNDSIDVWWADVMETASDECEPEWLDAEDPLFMLYTSGSTGKPKGVLHTNGGYFVYAATTFKYSFDHQPNDVFWCTADIGWITGHTYITYGPMANSATSILFEGVPTYPQCDRFWTICEEYKVTKFYTAPTAIRTLMKFSDESVTKHDLSSLKAIGTVGEPINPEAWHWYYNVVGGKRCSVPDTYWQTETGGHVITPLPGATPMKAGSATLPFFGIQPVLVDKNGIEIEGEAEGYLCLKKPWPGIMRTVYGDHDRFESTYFDLFKGYYFTGDGAFRDRDGYYWITGRADDVINVSGHRIGTAEVESALVEHPSVVEAAVVGRPHEVKTESMYCFVTLKQGAVFDETVIKELKLKVREKIGPFATPDVVQNAPALPKTRSGKIMRRILRKVAQNDRNMGDVSTLADSSVVEELFTNRID
ncbi:acetyl-coenzyme A synthetase, cytoplasmic-like [Oscarella lobularis]|uniref:acetyl-coenzyme A synthetase, cytoplasmic-like n=1 Tax=Oscarella lobularis TaxID=121494 RepID=UPI0033144C1B